MNPWTAAVLVTDADLTQYESRMPTLAKRTRADGANNSYDGKRALAKLELGQRLKRTGVDPEQLADPSELRLAAIFLELSLMYQDMAALEDTGNAQKADYYGRRFDHELNGIQLTLLPTPPAATTPTVRARANFWRA